MAAKAATTTEVPGVKKKSASSRHTHTHIHFQKKEQKLLHACMELKAHDTRVEDIRT